MSDNSKPVFQRGQRLTAAELNRLAGAVPVIQPGANSKISSSGDKVAVTAIPTELSGDIKFLLCKVVEVYDDHLLCSVLGDDDVRIPVAKPYLLRRTPFDTESIVFPDYEATYAYTDEHTRTVTYDEMDYEDKEVVSPPYFVDEYITARRGDQNFWVNKDMDETEETPGADSVPVLWEDCNTGGRVWYCPRIRPGKAKADINKGASGNIIETLAGGGTEKGSQFSAVNHSEVDVKNGNRVVWGRDRDGSCFFL